MKVSVQFSSVFKLLLKTEVVENKLFILFLLGDQLILPIEASMNNPNAFKRVLILAMGIVGGFFCCFGSCCVISFGIVDDASISAYLLQNLDKLEDCHFLNLSTVQILILANIIVSLSLVFTYPLQLFPTIGLSGQIVSRWNHHEEPLSHEVDSTPLLPHNDVERSSEDEVIHYSSLEVQDVELEDNESLSMEGDSRTLRLCLVLSTFLVAILIPHLKSLIAIAGAITGSMTSLLIPPLLALQFTMNMKENMDPVQYWMKILMNVSLISIGVIYFFIGTISSVENIISVLGEEDSY